MVGKEPLADEASTDNGETPLPAGAPSEAINVRTFLGSADSGVAINPGDRLKFARQILLYLFAFCMLVVGAYIYQPENKGAAAVFEFLKIGVLPLATLVIGFYFPNSSK